MWIKYKDFSAVDLERFRELQRTSFAILQQAAAELRPGQTEKQVARDLVVRYREAGAGSFFHLPVVLFGGRTALPGDWPVRNFFPGEHVLQENDSVIMDAAPLFDGYLVDTSYSFCCGEDPLHQQMMQNLAGFRDSVCEAVNAGHSFRRIAEDVAAQIRGFGYEPVHTKHPGEVLGHRALRTPNMPFEWRIQRFDGPALGWFLMKNKLAGLGLATAPLWNESETSDHPPADGLWMVEPHAGVRTATGSVGAKWEEILLIHHGHAEWLDAAPPHVQQWQQIARGNSYRPQLASG